MAQQATRAGISVPLLDLRAQYAPLRDDLIAAMVRVADSQYFINGPEVEGLERELAAMIGVAHAVGMSSGTDAILACLMALGVGPGDEVITPTYSFFATAGCVARLGATPRLVDSDAATFNLDATALDGLFSTRTKAVIPVHLFGLCADMDPVAAAARARGVAVIEDAAQAIGSNYHGRSAGTIGLAGCFSFFPSKNLGCFGDGGLVTTSDAAFARELRLMRGHGAEVKYFHTKVGGNFRLDALQAAVLRVKAPHLEGWTEGRRRNAERYREMFGRAAIAGVQLPEEPAGYRHIYNQFVIRVARRDELRAFLSSRGIGTEIYYPVPFHLQECFRSLGHARGDFPQAERAADTSLAIPIYPELTVAQQQIVVDAIAAFHARIG